MIRRTASWNNTELWAADQVFPARSVEGQIGPFAKFIAKRVKRRREMNLDER
ncbi:hypothetical protein [Niveispirillum irakense]|uniref:hypothetical protein n=1 Tax=Niveispirillum irakense TaxID=34011 RepID=UPI000403748C|nr:hypothetical protein [Niveispirillum irakense]